MNEKLRTLDYNLPSGQQVDEKKHFWISDNLLQISQSREHSKIDLQIAIKLKKSYLYTNQTKGQKYNIVKPTGRSHSEFKKKSFRYIIIAFSSNNT